MGFYFPHVIGGVLSFLNVGVENEIYPQIIIYWGCFSICLTEISFIRIVSQQIRLSLFKIKISLLLGVFVSLRVW